MGGQAQRALGSLSKAVLWFTQAGTHMDESAMRSQFRDEPGLSTIWQDVWLKMYWSYSSNYTLSRDAQKGALVPGFGHRTHGLAHGILGYRPFVDQSGSGRPPKQRRRPHPTPPAETVPPVVSAQDNTVDSQSHGPGFIGGI